jgi:hypothetical protein
MTIGRIGGPSTTGGLGPGRGQHRAEIARSGAILNGPLQTKDLKNHPYTNRTTLERAEATLAEPANPRRETGPIKLDQRTTAAWETVLN